MVFFIHHCHHLFLVINRCEYDGVYDGLNENNKKNIEDKDLNNNKK